MLDLNAIDTQELVESIGRAAAIALLAPPASGAASERAGSLFAALKSKQ